MRAHWEWWPQWLETAKTSKTILASKPGASGGAGSGGSTAPRALPPPPQGNAPGRTITGSSPLYAGTRPPASASITGTSVTKARWVRLRVCVCWCM